MNLKMSILQASRADAIPAAKSGLWFVQKKTYGTEVFATHLGKVKRIPPGSYTYLFRLTLANMMESNCGECVMHDTPEELQTHLGFMLRARGHVLITGLGLGCVLRGCLANPAVTKITVIERDEDVIRLVTPYIPADRFQVDIADAVDYCEKTAEKFDCAYHDLWSDDDKGEPHLQVTHSRLLRIMHPKVKMQGAWAFPREYRRLWRQTTEMI